MSRLLFIFLILTGMASHSQPPFISSIFPPGTVFHKNIPYAGDTVKRHQLDIYLPAGAGANKPLVVWIHGGAWMLNDKYADMSYMKNTVRSFIDSGYALASIDYRYSTDSIFPAQIRDCNRALQFLYSHAAEYGYDRNRIALIGFSAGGHLASLAGLSLNNDVQEFYPSSGKPGFKIKCVLDFYGPSDFLMMVATPDTTIKVGSDPLSLLLGAIPIHRPDLARRASPSTYVDKADPPFFIVQGEKDQSVPKSQSAVLYSWLKVSGVRAELTIVPNAPHYGEMFDVQSIRTDLFRFLRQNL